MRFNCGPSPEARDKALQEWHRWFAWRPVRIGENDCRWLETVFRRGTLGYGGLDTFWKWEYAAALRTEDEPKIGG